MNYAGHRSLTRKQRSSRMSYNARGGEMRTKANQAVRLIVLGKSA